jgi:ATP-binding cassette subfamily B protein
MQRLKTVHRLLRLVWRVNPRLLLSLITLTLLGGLLPAVTIFVNAQLIETLAAAVQQPAAAVTLSNTFVVLLALLGAVSVLGQLLTRLQSAVENLYRVRVADHVRLLIAEKSASLDLPFFEDPEFYNDLEIATTEASYRPSAIVTQAMVVAATLTTLFSVTVILLLWQPWIPPVIVLVSLGIFWVSARLNRDHLNMVIANTSAFRRSMYVNALVTGNWAAKEVRLFSLQQFLLANLRSLLDQIYARERQIERRRVLLASPVEMILSGVPALLIAFTAFQAIVGRLSLGGFSLYTQSILQFQSGIATLMATLGQLHEHQLFVDKLFRFLDLQPQIEAPRPRSASAMAQISASPRIEFRNVSFRYPQTDAAVIEQLSFCIRPGEKVALVGENGVGKTTLVKLLSGLYEPSQGRILLDGVDIAQLSRQDLRAYLSVIFQDYFIYHFSVADNVGIGSVDSIHDRARIEAAARRSGLDRLVAQLPNGYETILERSIDLGYELSGGQRQLVAITRALARQAPVLVLDEPTAALDAEAEERFFRYLLDEQADADQTVIFISHRFSTIRRADRILVLEGGAVVEAGSHDELMARRGRYARLFTLQARMYGMRPDSEPALNGSAHPERTAIASR